MAHWGTNAIAVISKILQHELPGLRGFSETGIKRMRTFYEGWEKYISNRPTPSDEFKSISESLAISMGLCQNRRSPLFKAFDKNYFF